MKRTREVIFYEHPEQRWNLSGCTKFDGEDLPYEERRKQDQANQKAWCMQQMEEKRLQKEADRQADLNADAQRMGIKKLNDSAHD